MQASSVLGPGSVLHVVFALLVVKDLSARFRELEIFSVASRYVDFVILVIMALAALLTFVVISRQGFSSGSLAQISSIAFLMYWAWYVFRVAPSEAFPGAFAALGLGLLISLAGINASDFVNALVTYCRSYILLSFVLTGAVAVSGIAGDKHGLDLFNLDIGLRGLASHPNLFAVAAALGLVLEALSRRGVLSWVWRGGFVVALLLSYSFGSLFSVTASFMLLGAMWLQSEQSKARGLIVLLVGAVTALASLFTLAAFGRLESLSSFTTGRVAIWIGLLDVSGGAWIVGSGLTELREHGVGLNAHSDVFQAFSVAGLIGVFLLLAAISLRTIEVAKLSSAQRTQLFPLLTFALVLGVVEIPLAPSFSVLFLLSSALFFSRTQVNSAVK